MSNRDVKDIVEGLKGIYTEPLEDIGDAKTIPDCPITGNGKISVAAGGSVQEQTYFITKSDFWFAADAKVYDYTENMAQPDYPPYQIQPAALGGLTISIVNQGKSNSQYQQEQDMYSAEIRSILPTEGGNLKLRAITPFAEDYFLVQLTAEGKALDINAEIWVNAQDDAFDTSSGLNRDILWCKRENTSLWTSQATLSGRVMFTGDKKNYSDSHYKAGASFHILPGEFVWIAVGVAGGRDGQDYVQKVIESVNTINIEAIEQMVAQHRCHWANYWSKSYVCLNDIELERYYYGALYVLACSTDIDGAVPPGIAGGWIHNGNPLWAGNYTMNYNAQSPFLGVYSSNRPELGMPFVRMVMDYLPEGKKLAEELGTRGILMPVHINPWGTCDLRDPIGQKGNASLSAINFIWQYEFTQDNEFLQKYAYPYIRACVEFWEDNLVKDSNNLYFIENTAQRERWPGDLNPNNELGYARRVITAAVQWSERLGVDNNKRIIWEDLLVNLSTYPTMIYDQKIVYKEAENRKHMSFNGIGDNPVNMDHVYPAEALDMQDDPHLLQIARNTLEVMNSWNQGNAFPRIFSQAVRAHWPGNDLLRRFKERITKGPYPCEVLRRNQTIIPMGHGIEAVGAIEFINSMLIQAHDGTIKVFPLWPRDHEVYFKNLRVRGAFLVSAELNNQEVEKLEIFSEKGGICRLENPWTGKLLRVIEIGTAEGLEINPYNDHNLWVWETKPGAKYCIEPSSVEYYYSQENGNNGSRKLSINSCTNGYVEIKNPWPGSLFQVQDSKGNEIDVNTGEFDNKVIEFEACKGEIYTINEILAPLLVIHEVDKCVKLQKCQGDGPVDVVLDPLRRSAKLDISVVMSDGSVVQNPENVRFESSNPYIAFVDNNCIVNSDKPGIVYIIVSVNVNGIEVSNKIIVSVLDRIVLHDVLVETGSGYDGWGHPMWNPECMVDGSGMSDPDISATQRGNPYGFGMYLTPELPGEKAWVLFDLKQEYSLDEMWVWNYNCSDDAKEKHIWGQGTACGFRDVKIEYSTDKEMWIEMKGQGYPYRFCKASGDAFIKATNLGNGVNSPVFFGGVKARYVRITADQTPGIGNWGGKRYGLSAVRFTVII